METLFDSIGDQRAKTGYCGKMDVVDLREYYANPLGKTTQQLIHAQLAARMPQDPQATVMGLGYATPYLIKSEASSARQLAFMPARRGVIAWPEQGFVASTLVDELDLPLSDNAIDAAVLVHCLEFTDSPEELLQEVWRVLAPQGKLLLVVPNRSSLWAMRDISPFGHGQPFSRHQLQGLLKAAQFSTTRMDHALVLPPSQYLAGQPVASWVDRLCRGSVFRSFSGALIIEAQKQVYAYAPSRRIRRALPRFKPAFLPAPQPTQRKI
ncbi:MAG: methyltransferase domain-containing protein [Alphaproteobacteria bacterium]|nr:methyltransferase domain-containing protein [Alphaproteobacteria bacterium]